MKDKFSKFINLQGKYLTSLLFVLFFAVGQMWADKYYVLCISGGITDEGVLTSASNSNQTLTIVKYDGSKYATSTDITLSDFPSAKSGKYTNSSIANLLTSSNWGTGSGSSYATGPKFTKNTSATIKLGSLTASKISFLGYPGGKAWGITIAGSEKTETNNKNWFTHEVSGTFTGDVTVSVANTNDIYGVFVIETSASTTYTVTYLPGAGSGPDYIIDDDATTVSGCPAQFSYTGHDFAGWKDALNNDVAVGAAVTSDMTLTAQWVEHVAKYTVKYLDGTTVLGTEEVNVGSTPAGLASDPVKDCYTFAAWSPALSSVSGSDGDVVEVNATWTPKYASTLDFAAVTMAGTTGANPIGTFLASGNMVASNLGGDSGWETSTAKSGFIGYKVKNTSAVIKFLVKAGKEVEITLGSVGAAAKLNKGGVESEIAKASGDNAETVIPAFVAAADMLVTITTNASSNSTVTLKKISIVDPAPKYTVTYDLNGATGTTPTEVSHKEGEKFNLHDGATGITAPTNKTFVNWKDQDDNEFAGGAEYTMPGENVTLTAQWAGDVYTVKFMDGETVLDTKVVEVGSHPADIEHPTKPLYTFAAWQLSGSDVVLDNVNGTKDATVILTARWAVAYASNVNFKEAATQALGVETALNTYHYASDAGDISFEEKGLKIKTDAARFYFNVAPGKVAEIKFGNISGATYSVDGGAAETLTSSQLKATYSASAQSCVMTMTTAAYNIVEKVTIHDPYQVSYDPHGADAIAAQYGTPSVTLPTPANGTGVFKGWYDAATEGNKIGNAGAEYMPTANITLHAQWETVSSDNTLSDLQVDGATVAGFDPDVHIYNLGAYEYGQHPSITSATATAEAQGATVSISNTPVHYQDEDNDFWYVQANVTPASGTPIGYNQVRYTNLPKQGATIFKAELTAADDADYSGMYADEANSQIALSDDGANGYKFGGKSNFIKMAIADAAFAEGDMLKMTYTTNPQQGELAIYDGTTKLQGTPYANNTLTFSDAVGTDKSTLFIRRTDDNKFNGWVAAVEVQRYMDPVIKSFTIGEAVGTIDQVNKTIAVEVPYGTNVTALTPVIAAYANGGATLDKTGAQDFSSPVTYKVSSAYAEDGDVTYTVTVTVADHYEAMIVGGASYATLVEAVATAQADDVVKLLDNVDLTTGSSTGLTIAANITLNLNGFNIKAGEKLNNNINVPAGVKLTLVDNSANAEGKIYTEEAYSGAATGYGVIRVSGEFLMQSGNIYAVIDSDPANLGQFAVVIAAGGKVTVEGGQIKAGWYAISNNGLNSGSTIIVSGGELISTADYAIYNPAKESTVTVSGGVVYGAAGGIAMNRGELTVTGGTITSKDQGTTGTWGDGTGDLSNAAISASGKYESVEVEISGGTIIAEGTAVMITNGTTNPVEVAISGGQFSHVVPAEYCAPGFAPVTEPNAQGKYEVEDKRIYIFDGSTMSNMATSPSGAIAWEIVGTTMGAGDKNKTYEGVHYTRALSCGSSSTTKHFRIDVALNNAAKIEVIGMSNSSSDTRHAWLTNSTEKGDFADAIAGLTTTGYNPEMFATDWLEEGSYYLHSDNTVAIFLIRVTEKAVDPKCEQPTITTQPQTNITFGAGNMTATVVAEVSDEGTLTYQWYNAANDEAVVGQTTATLTTTTEGTYYVIVTNTLANHRDNSIKSDEAQLAHRVMDDATLSALSYGDPATAITLVPDQYEYDVYLAKGTTVVPALSATATMNGYAIVNTTDAVEFVNYEATSTVNVESEDHSANLTYTVHFKVAHSIDALVDVTENTIWDWTEITARADGSAIDVPSGTKVYGPSVTTEDGLVLANYVLGGDNWDKIEGNNGAYAIRSSENMFYQGANLHIHTTKGGMLKIKARNDGSTMSLKVENAGRDMNLGTLPKNNFQDYVVYVQAGDVVIYNDPETAGKPMRVQRIEFTVKETPDYSRDVTNNIGTLCVDHNVLAGGFLGATFYQIASRNQEYDYKIDFEEVLPGEELKAGEPYIFKSTTGRIDLYYGETVAAQPVAIRGMIGSFANTTLDITEENKSDILYIAQNKLWNCEDLVASDLEVVANRAYIVMSDVPTYDEYHNQQPNNAPIRRCLTISGDQAPAVITGVEDLNVGDQPVKVMIDGQMFILRGEKMYDAQGRLVK